MNSTCAPSHHHAIDLYTVPVNVRRVLFYICCIIILCCVHSDAIYSISTAYWLTVMLQLSYTFEATSLTCRSFAAPRQPLQIQFWKQSRVSGSIEPGSHWLPMDCLITAYWLRIDCLLTVYWLHVDWLRVDYILALYWPYIDRIVTVYWLQVQ